MRRKPIAKSGSEQDLVGCKNLYNWAPGQAAWLKAQMNRRFRREAKAEVKKEVDE